MDQDVVRKETLQNSVMLPQNCSLEMSMNFGTVGERIIS
jgi:hypothetical protein